MTESIHKNTRVFLFEKGSGNSRHCIGIIDSRKSAGELQQVIGTILGEYRNTAITHISDGYIDIRDIPSGEGERIRKQILEILSPAK